MDGMTWRRLLRWALVAGIVEYAVVTVAAREVIPPLVVIAVLLGVAAALLPRRSGAVLGLVALVVFLASNLAFALRDLLEPRSFPGFAVMAASVVTAVVGIVAAVRGLRADAPAPAGRRIATACAVVFVAVTAVNLAGSLTYDEPDRGSNDVLLAAHRAEWSTEELTVPAGEVTFFLDNKDAALHNFHVKGGETVSMPASHAARATCG